MKKVWIFGGSFCTGYQNGAGGRDWIAQLDADVTVWACNPQSPKSQYLMLEHALQHHFLERLLQEPDLIIYDYPPVNRVHLPTSIPESEQTMLNCKKWATSRTGHKFECGSEPDKGEHWSHRSLTTIDEWHKWRTDEPAHTAFVNQTKKLLIQGKLPDHSQMEWTVKALDKIAEKNIPYVWFCVNNENHLVAKDHLNSYVDIMTLDNTIPTQNYNSKTANHLSIYQNTLWSMFFNNIIN